MVKYFLIKQNKTYLWINSWSKKAENKSSFLFEPILSQLQNYNFNF
jgi:hypothetical protein